MYLWRWACEAITTLMATICTPDWAIYGYRFYTNPIENTCNRACPGGRSLHPSPDIASPAQIARHICKINTTCTRDRGKDANSEPSKYGSYRCQSVVCARAIIRTWRRACRCPTVGLMYFLYWHYSNIFLDSSWLLNVLHLCAMMTILRPRWSIVFCAVTSTTACTTKPIS